MNHKELLAAMSAKLGITQKEAGAGVEEWVESIRQKMIEEQAVTLPGIGFLETKLQEQRTIVNPKTKQKMLVPPKYEVNFRASQKTKNVIK